MALALELGDRKVGDGGTYRPKLQDDIGSLGVVLHCFLAGLKHYFIGKNMAEAVEDYDMARPQLASATHILRPHVPFAVVRRRSNSTEI